MEIHYKKSYKNGLYKSWYPSGNILIEAYYTNGLRNGPYKEYFDCLENKIKVETEYIIND